MKHAFQTINFVFLTKISPQYVHLRPVDNRSSLFEVLDWLQPSKNNISSTAGQILLCMYASLDFIANQTKYTQIFNIKHTESPNLNWNVFRLAL